MDNSKNQDYVYFFDTTLRDGEQAPGASMNEEEKVAIAHQLAKLKIDIIEAGFPVSSPIQYKTVERIAKEVEGPTIAALARAVRADIEAAGKALKPAKKARIHTFIATSEIHMKHKLNKTPSQTLQAAVEAVKMAKDFIEEVEFSAEDATRSDIVFLSEITEAVIEAGATIINLPDTVGYTTPKEYAFILDTLIAKVSNIKKAILSTHCHNDLGLAVANSLTAIQHGARQVEGTINGIGERAGNTALEEVIMAIKTRSEMYPVTIGIDTTQIYRTSQTVSKLSGMMVQRNKAIIGANAFAHESGIHQDGMLKNRLTYEIMTPESIGLTKSDLVLGRHSGRAGFKNKIQELGFNADNIDIEKAYNKFLEVADKKKEIFDTDILMILDDQISTHTQNNFTLKDFKITSGISTKPIAWVSIHSNENNQEAESTGDGPIDALFNAIEKAISITTQLEQFQISPSSKGNDATGEANVGLKIDTKIYYGKGSSTDIIEASAKAYIDAINKYQQSKIANFQETIKEGI